MPPIFTRGQFGSRLLADELVILLPVLRHGASLVSAAVPDEVIAAEVAGSQPVHAVLALPILLVSVNRIECACDSREHQGLVLVDVA